MNQRRTFLKNTALTLGGMSFMQYLEPFQPLGKKHISLQIFATNWGFRGNMIEFCRNAKEAGYDGIEVWIPQSEEKTRELLNAVQTYELKLGVLAGNWGSSVEQNLSVFKRSIDLALKVQPEFINCHSGKDFFNSFENDNFLQYTFEKSDLTGIPIYHETHRGRILYSATVAEKFIDQFPQLKITLDISHWCCVHESLLADQSERIDKVLKRVGHIHSRIGFPEAPQIPDPDDAQFKAAVKAHFGWWDSVVNMKIEKGETLTMTTEFGPPPYMWTHLGSGDPLASNWDINVVMRQTWIDRYLRKS